MIALEKSDRTSKVKCQYWIYDEIKLMRINIKNVYEVKSMLSNLVL